MHWVAIAADHQGQGLSKPLLSAVLRRLVELGHTKAYLTTSTERPVALALYRLLGSWRYESSNARPSARHFVSAALVFLGFDLLPGLCNNSSTLPRCRRFA